MIDFSKKKKKTGGCSMNRGKSLHRINKKNRFLEEKTKIMKMKHLLLC